MSLHHRLAGLGVHFAAQGDYDPAALVRSNILNSVGTIPMTLGYLWFLVVLDGWAREKWIKKVRALGQMALTNYLMQTVLGLTLAWLATGTAVSRTHIWGAIVVVWVLQLWGSEWWLRRHRYGPVEWLWRCATYRRFEPLRRSSGG